MPFGIGINNLAGLAAAVTGNAPALAAMTVATKAAEIAARVAAEVAAQISPQREEVPPQDLRETSLCEDADTSPEATAEEKADGIADSMTEGCTIDQVAERRGTTRNQILEALRNGGMTVSESNVGSHPTNPSDIQTTTVVDDGRTITETRYDQSTSVRSQDGDTFTYHADDADGGTIDSTANQKTGDSQVTTFNPDTGRTIEKTVNADGLTSVRMSDEPGGEIRTFEVAAGPTAHLEIRLREEGLLEGGTPPAGYQTWLDNAVANGVSADTMVDIAKNHDITATSFDALDKLEAVTDRDGKTFYILPTDISGADAQQAVVLTYIQNADTGYATAAGAENNDFAATPYGSAEVQRIADRQAANDWTYNEDVGFVHDNGGRLAATPNGMLMGLGGNWLQDRFSTNGGTAWGDAFMMNIDGPTGAEAGQILREAIESGEATFEGDNGEIYQSNLDLDRLLHHEERHSQQWAEKGHSGMLADYAWEAMKAFGDGEKISFEQDAGLRDGGYA